MFITSKSINRVRAQRIVLIFIEGIIGQTVENVLSILLTSKDSCVWEDGKLRR